MKKIFDDLAAASSKATTNAYSTSFSLGIKFLYRDLHKPIYAIYGFVRFADEIVDSFHGFDKAYLLEKFKKDTYEAIELGISLNPILHSFQEAVNQYKIDRTLIDTFFSSMEMDLLQVDYDEKKFDEYILGSAEVVGLMCLHVFVNNDLNAYEHLKPAAMSLGAAFQKINFLRDVKQDFEELGRSYFPGVNLKTISNAEKKKIEQEIEKDFHDGLAGIKQLPLSSRRGVYLAYYYYKNLFNKIKRVAPQQIMKERIRIPGPLKLILMFKSYVRYQINLL